MTRVGHVLYLHGFASSPASSKAVRFQHELRRWGIGFSCPDFNLPEFETLTITRMLDQTSSAIHAAPPGGPIAIVGSSLGAFVALHAAANDGSGRVDRLLLLAPALDLVGNPLQHLDRHGIDEWRRTGRLRVFHHAWGEERDLHFALWDDLLRYDALGLNVPLPMLVYQGRQDDAVSPAMVEQWARGRANVELHMVEDGHQLTASVDEIWRRAAEFLGVAPDR
jgi:pimeloyl-ACP methyl ester carboxylesterase